MTYGFTNCAYIKPGVAFIKMNFLHYITGVNMCLTETAQTYI